MSARNLLAFAAALPLFMMTAEAKADNDASHAAFEHAHPVMLRSGASFVTSNHDGVDYQHADTFAGVGYDWSPRLSLYADLHYGTTRFGYKANVEDGLAVDGRFTTPLDVSASTGLTLHLLKLKPFWMDIDGDFEASVLNSTPHIVSLAITTPQGNFDIAPYAQRNAHLSTAWYRMRIGATFGMRFGFVEPHLSLAFEYVHASLDVGLNADSRESLTMLGHDSGTFENPHQAAFFDVLLSPGIDFHLGRRDSVGVSGTMALGNSIDTFGAMLLFRHRF